MRRFCGAFFRPRNRDDIRLFHNERIKKKFCAVKMALKRPILYLQWGKGRVKFTHNRLKGEATLLKKERKLWKTEVALSLTSDS